MQAARRLYLYVMSGITLGVISFGFVLLVQAILDGVFPDPAFQELRDSRQQLSQAVAMLGVGIPVWAVHWWLVQRGLREGRPERDAERGSEIRAIYLTLLLAASLVVWVLSAIALLHWAITTLLDVVPEDSSTDPLGALAVGVTGFVVWLYHGLVRRRDLAAGPVAGPAAWVPRLYLYGVSLGALVATLTALESVISWLVFPPDFGIDDAYAKSYLAEQVISVVAWAIVWSAHWMYASRLVRDPGWRGTEERASRMRVGAFVVTILLAAGSTLTGVASAASGLLFRLFPEPGLGLPIEDGITEAAASLLRIVPWTVTWYAHARALRREPAAKDPRRALHQERLISHGVAAVALAIGAGGAGWTLGYVLDILLGGQRTAGGIGAEASAIRQWVPMTLVGLVAWGWFWRSVVARRRSDPVGEAQSTIRRAFLFLTIAVALVAAIAAAALILYRLVGVLLNAGLGGNLMSELSTPLGGLAVALAVLAYHGLQLRTDLALASEAEPAARADQPVPVERGVVEPATMQRVAFELVGPAGADLDAALSAARSALPPGVDLVVPEG
jgi:hypothetical protein